MTNEEICAVRDLARAQRRLPAVPHVGRRDNIPISAVFLDEVLTELESEFDPNTRWALAWFEQHPGSQPCSCQ